MRRLIGKLRGGQGFTLVELMIVVTIVAILALIAIPLYSANTVSAIMSEGVAGAGTIRSAARVYLSQGNPASNITSLTVLVNAGLLGGGDLEGKYFAQGDYSITGSSTSNYTITAGPPSKTTKTTLNYKINQAGAESGTYTTGN